MSSRIGYVRIWRGEPESDLQLQALEHAGCDEIFYDRGTTKDTERNGLDDALAALEQGDVLVVWRLDRLAKSLSALVRLLADLGTRGFALYSINESIDTQPSRKMPALQLMVALAEFERSLVREQTRAGMQAAKLKGKHIGRRPLLTAEQVDDAIIALERPGSTFASVANKFNVSSRSLRRLVAQGVQAND